MKSYQNHMYDYATSRELNIVSSRIAAETVKVRREGIQLWAAALKNFFYRLIVFAALITPLVTSALACSCIGIGPPCQAAWLQADAVFVGRVYWSSLVTSKDTAEHVILHRMVKVKVLEPFIGDVSGWVSVETGLGGGDCGFNFSWWEKYVIYAHRAKDGSLTTSICTRTQKVSDASADLTYLRTIKSLPGRGRVYGTVKQYTFDPNSRPIEVSIMSPYPPGPEEQLLSMRPLSGTAVRIKRAEDTSEQTVRVGQDGDFAFENLDPGRYEVSVDLPALMQPWEPRELTVPAKGCSEVNVRTAFNGRLTGKVADKTGVGVAYVAVEVLQASEAENAEHAFRWITANKDGTFEVGPLPPGDYVLGVRIARFSGEHKKPKTYYPGVHDLREAKRIHLREGQLIQGLNFQLDLEQVPD